MNKILRELRKIKARALENQKALVRKRRRRKKKRLNK